jgi:hypothetical protein
MDINNEGRGCPSMASTINTIQKCPTKLLYVKVIMVENQMRKYDSIV